MMTRGLSRPHILLASANVMEMIGNLDSLLTQAEVNKLVNEINRNVRDLFLLGQSHFDFASRLTDDDWRQKISRLYYGVYNVRRAVVLKFNGTFSTDSSDHQRVNQLPDGLANRESHIDNLKALREDRNLADYSHLATIGDLVIAPGDALAFAALFIGDSREFLRQRSVVI